MWLKWNVERVLTTYLAKCFECRLKLKLVYSCLSYAEHPIYPYFIVIIRNVSDFVCECEWECVRFVRIHMLMSLREKFWKFRFMFARVNESNGLFQPMYKWCNRMLYKIDGYIDTHNIGIDFVCKHLNAASYLSGS